MQTSVKTMITGLRGWACMGRTQNETVRVIDTAITVVATLLVAATWAMFR